MNFLKFRISSFKGAKNVVLSIEPSTRANIFTLVGLNESGKSTILEALSHIGPEYLDLKKEDPSGGLIGPEDCLKFIPVAEKHNFNGQISISADLALSSEDRAKIADFLRTQCNLSIVKLADKFVLKRYFLFKDSKYVSQGTEWSLIPVVKKLKGRKEFSLAGDDWQKLIRFIRSIMPKVLFFRNELFDIPEKIYIGKGTELEEPGGINAFYRDVVQDVLFAIDPSLNVNTHIVSRKKSKSESDKHSLDSVLEKMSLHMTQTVMQQWEKIFNRKLKEKSIRVVCDVDESGLFYLQIRLIDGGEVFNINQRSTGFRWFFVFILLTQYRGYRNESAIFLYDEPASNLHSSAQQQLLQCFSQLPAGFTIIYSTHSHYLIRPEWLDSTYVVQNEAAVESLEIENFSLAKTDIKVKKYRNFVSDNPNGLNYFQPVLDVLQYVPSKFDFIKDAVFMEGKSDFYFMSYMAGIQLGRKLSFDVIPCGGSGTVDQMISLFSGWGKNFVVLLDADQEGEKAKKRYMEKFGLLVQGRIVTYADINNDWKQAGLEKILGEEDATAICIASFPQASFSKKNLSLAVQEHLVLKKSIELSGNATKNFGQIFNYLETAFLT